VFQASRDDGGRKTVVCRMYAGALSKGDAIRKARSEEPADKICRIFQVFADDLVEVPSAQAGDIVALEVEGQWKAGDSLFRPEGDEIRFEADHKARLVLELALEAASAEEHAKLTDGLKALTEEDGGIDWCEEPETGRCILRGQGELQLEIALEMLREAHTTKFKAWQPHVRRRERLASRTGPKSEKAEWAGHWLELQASVAPTDEGTTIQWTGNVPEGIRAAAEAGIHETMGNGHAGHGSLEGAHWELEIVGMSPNAPAALGKKILDHLGPQLLKEAGVLIEIPAVKALIQTPDEHLGALLASMKSKGAEIQAVDTQRNGSTIKIFSPLEAMIGCATLVRSLSKGQALLSLEPSGWVAASA